jgi:YHS domain-containing protein
MVRLALVLILFIFLARAFWRVVDGVIEGLGGLPRTPARHDQTGTGIQMVRDPVCGTFLLPERALTMTDGRRELFFCSTACRDKYRARSA